MAKEERWEGGARADVAEVHCRVGTRWRVAMLAARVGSEKGETYQLCLGGKRVIASQLC